MMNGTMIRGIIQAVWEGAIKRCTAAGRSDETITNREYFQHYGYTSRPLQGAEAIIIHDGNNFIMIASDDRRYRLAIEDGEVALYTDEGDNIHFQRGKKIVVTSGNEVDVTAPIVKVNASTECEIISPAINLGGDRSGLRRLIDERLLALFNEHTHPGTGTPSVTLTYDNTCTSITEAI